MKHIIKSTEPQSLIIFKKTKKTKKTEWNKIHDCANRHVYEDCLNQCAKDQGNLCAYTEICLNDGDSHIDHFVKRSIDPRLTFAWNNMVAAIKESRFGADWKDIHISTTDYDRVRKKYTTILNPVTDQFLGRFRFVTDGSIEANNSQDELATQTISIFNLNEKSLRERRKEAMENARLLNESGMSKKDIIAYLSPYGFISAIEYECNNFK